MRSTRSAQLIAGAAALVLAGCGTARRLEPASRGAVNCTLCHGQQLAAFDPDTDLTWAAPPVGTGGGTQPADLDVGQHQAHLNAGPFALAFACETCHSVPTDLGHATEPVVVSLRGAGQALLPASLGTYDATAHTCDTYCTATRSPAEPRRRSRRAGPSRSRAATRATVCRLIPARALSPGARAATRTRCARTAP